MSELDGPERPALRLIPGDSEDPQRDPIDALADVLAGPDGDPEHARYIAQGVVERGTVPPAGPGDWLRRVLHDESRRAERMSADLDTHVWRGDTLGWVADADRALARSEAERAILNLHDGPHDCPDAADGCAVVRWLAYGHRVDTAGWRPEWDPHGT